MTTWGVLAATAEPWDPLAESGVTIAIAVAIIIGGAVAVGWWVCLLPLALLTFGWIESDYAAPNAWGGTVALVLIFGVPATALAVGLQLLLRRFLSERSVTRGRLAGWAIVALGVSATIVAAYLGTREHDHEPQEPALISEPEGAIRSVALGDSVETARAQLGPGRIVRPRSAWLQAVAPDNYYGPGLTERRGQVLLYPDLAITTNTAERVAGIQTFDHAAQTSRGVGIGDSIAIARDRYPSARCRTPQRNTDFAQDDEPECIVTLPRRRAITFWGDPIKTIRIERD